MKQKLPSTAHTFLFPVPLSIMKVLTKHSPLFLAQTGQQSASYRFLASRPSISFGRWSLTTCFVTTLFTKRKRGIQQEITVRCYFCWPVTTTSLEQHNREWKMAFRNIQLKMLKWKLSSHLATEQSFKTDIEHKPCLQARAIKQR